MAQDANAHLNGTGSDGDGDGDSEVAESGPDDDNELDDEEDEELDDDYMQQLAKEARRLKVAVHMAISCILVCWLLSSVHNLLTRHASMQVCQDQMCWLCLKSVMQQCSRVRFSIAWHHHAGNC